MKRNCLRNTYFQIRRFMPSWAPRVSMLRIVGIASSLLIASAALSTSARADTSGILPPPTDYTITTDDTTGVQNLSGDLTVSATECAQIEATYGTQDCPESVGLEIQPSGTGVGVEPSTSAAVPYRIYYEIATYCYGDLKWGGASGFGCNLSYIQVKAYYKHWYNSPRTWILQMSRPCPWNAIRGFSVSQTWCSWTGNGTNNMTTGANFDWSSPSGSGNAWMRIHNQPCGGWCVRETLNGGPG
jgi:hypothetical protein